MNDTEVTVDLLMRMDKPVPRYTSYPTAPAWENVTPQDYEKRLEKLDEKARPISLYVHIPFCRSMCLYCACSVVLNRKPKNEERYVDYLLKEIELMHGRFKHAHPISQLHFGGGTPTQLTEAQMERAFKAFEDRFGFEQDAEISIEIDPRTVVEDNGSKLRHLRRLGFNRVSFGVQDFNQKVLEAVRRLQGYDMTRKTFLMARELGFEGINIDLIYGLPHQTVETFEDTVKKVVGLGPDRIALFSYAKVPWLKPHQKAIPDDTLPSTEEKFGIYCQARQYFIDHGYIAIGMDHFAKKDDEMAQAYLRKQLHRNFQGYTLRLSDDLLGLGVSSIGYCQNAYFQNRKELKDYYDALDRGELPLARGKLLNDEDLLRQWVINSLMCNFEVDKGAFEARFGEAFDTHFALECGDIRELAAQGLVEDGAVRLAATPTGRLFIRNVAAVFDAYLRQNVAQKGFSKAI